MKLYFQTAVLDPGKGFTYDFIDFSTNNEVKKNILAPVMSIVRFPFVNALSWAIASEAVEMQRDYAAICHQWPPPPLKCIVLPGLIGVYPQSWGKISRIISREIRLCNGKLITLVNSIFGAKVKFTRVFVTLGGVYL